ncbi:hypothetical protein [Flavivirga algicola]|uniref:Uncharacterized protein n=1 Tax=Flavivirga algicola TaxID=2729136 RepID=A0ABX1S1M3_9FLAO|nr:hypothetical protein [Flavivirga algicola]NMH88788.1 hypothetical protein [Flavivirga algicola]
MRKRSYKSFVMNFSVNKAKKKHRSVSKNDNRVVLEPKMESKKKATIVVSHYDENQSISLSLPESLCSDHSPNDETYGNQNNNGTSISQQPKRYDNIEDAIIVSGSQSVSSNTEPYSDANNYFIAAHDELEDDEDKNKAFLLAKSVDVSPQETQQEQEVKGENNPQEAQNTESQVEEVQNPIELDREADKKFEEDLRAILSQKTTNDKKREQNDPAEASKNKDNGIVDESDEAFKKELKNRHAIFDQIAQSMKMADAYDFGAIAMNKKLDSLEEETNEDFTQKIEEVLNREEEKERPSYSGKREDDNKILTEDFLEDINKLNELSSEQSENSQDFAEDAIILEDTTEPKKEESINEPKSDSSNQL